MNIDRPSTSGADQFRSLQILDELSVNDSLTQRDLSKRLGIALGLVNSYIKNLVAKGYITVTSIPSKRYVYFLTPKGLAEKSRLTYDLLHDYTRIYREARNNLKKVFYDLENRGSRRIVFAGVDEVAEIAYITLQETGLQLVGVLDDENDGKFFFGRRVSPIRSVTSLDYDTVLVTSYLKRETVKRALINSTVNVNNIQFIFTEK
ncbi:MAG TPA: winged helix-turn-helix transcriptional regulator [Nitrospirota bacterium]|nr:winged helix-turn-helix transcriptional regulator [Nitrospirota bacterium]